jgi:hypothetical protein
MNEIRELFQVMSVVFWIALALIAWALFAGRPRS